ncbi:MAG TPA: hypothetical protein VFN67_08335 [Polyangiales bacterium]|nr:hypothetical protein [Polyangiales bacterium]
MAEPNRAFRERVSKRARSFELKPLIELLLTHGYRREQLLFESNREGGATSLVHSIHFSPDDTDVLITVNLGLLGDNTLLPSYFLREVEHGPDPQRFYDFIRFFDHRLIDNYVRASWPEDDPNVYGDYTLLCTAVLKLIGLDSASSVYWLMQSAFPELGVRVTRGAFPSATSSHACRTGQSLLDGSSVIGRVYETEAQGFLVDLVCDEEAYDSKRNWAAVVRERLSERCLPVLAPFLVPLRIVLTVLSHASWARLENARAQTSGYLGYDRIKDTTDGQHSVVIWSGIAGESETLA